MTKRNTKYTLGQILAYLYTERSDKNPDHTFKLSTEETEQLDSMRQRFEKISFGENFFNILTCLPNNQCNGEIAHLQSNEDVFFAILSLGLKNGDCSKDCKQLFNHLNSCFRCFEIFSDVMRDFYFKSQELYQKS